MAAAGQCLLWQTLVHAENLGSPGASQSNGGYAHSDPNGCDWTVMSDSLFAAMVDLSPKTRDLLRRVLVRDDFAT
jgi:hypothetical protein